MQNDAQPLIFRKAIKHTLVSRIATSPTLQTESYIPNLPDRYRGESQNWKFDSKNVSVNWLTGWLKWVLGMHIYNVKVAQQQRAGDFLVAGNKPAVKDNSSRRLEPISKDVACKIFHGRLNIPCSENPKTWVNDLKDLATTVTQPRESMGKQRPQFCSKKGEGGLRNPQTQLLRSLLILWRNTPKVSSPIGSPMIRRITTHATGDGQRLDRVHVECWLHNASPETGDNDIGNAPDCVSPRPKSSTISTQLRSQCAVCLCLRTYRWANLFLKLPMKTKDYDSNIPWGHPYDSSRRITIKSWFPAPETGALRNKKSFQWQPESDHPSLSDHPSISKERHGLCS